MESGLTGSVEAPREGVGERPGVPGPRICEVLLDQRAQAEAFVQLAREQEPGIGGHRGSPEFDAKLGIFNWPKVT